MWLETITVRTATLGELEQQIPSLLTQLSEDAPHIQVNAYTRYPTNSDLSFHLIHRHAPLKPTSEGVRLADALRAYGSVDHSTWKAVRPSLNKHSNRRPLS
ncbi:MAG: hypothetical protein AAF485_21735 [Chloroflexota bacterium]